MLLIPVLNPPPYAKGRKNKMKNPVVVQDASGNLLTGRMAQTAFKRVREGKGNVLDDGRVEVKVGGQLRYVAVGGYEGARSGGYAQSSGKKGTRPGAKSKAPKTLRAAAKARAMRAAAKKEADEAHLAQYDEMVDTWKKHQAAVKHKRRLAKARKGSAGKAKSMEWRQGKTKSGRKRGSTRGRSYAKGTKFAQKAETIGFAEAAHRSGAVYPAEYPSGHPQAGKKHPRAGRAMTFSDALEYQVPIVGYLSRSAIKQFYKMVPRTADGGIDFKAKGAKKKLQAAMDYMNTQRFGGVRLADGSYVPNKINGKGNKAAVKKALEAKGKKKAVKSIKGLEEQRKERGSAWRRAPVYYSRSGKRKDGYHYRGERIKDYEQYWSDKAEPWQDGGGKHLRVKYRKGRGVRYSVPLYLGFGPDQAQQDEIQLGGFGGTHRDPGGVVKLNRGRRRKNPRRQKAGRRAPSRNKKGRFLKRRNPKAKKAKSRRRRGGKKKAEVKVFNNPKHRRKKASKKRKRDAKGHFVAANGRKRKRRSKRHHVAANGRKRYRRKKGAKRHVAANKGRKTRRRSGKGRKFGLMKNPLQAQLAQLKSQSFWLRVAHVTVGMVGTAFVGNMLMSAGPLRQLTYGQTLGKKLGRFAVGLVAAGGCSGLAYLARTVKFVGPQGWLNVLVGGAVYSSVNLLNDLFRSPLVPSITVGRPAVTASLPVGDGVGDWMNLSGMGGGMGLVEDASSLVAGESAAQPYQLGGLAGSGGSPIPLEDLRGYPGQYGGMGGWIELNDDAAVMRDSVGMPGESF